MAQLNFDSTNVAPAVAPEAIPSGWYKAYMSNSEMKPTKDGNGSLLSIEYTLMEGQYAGTKQFDRLNLQNPNPVAVEIAYKQLSAICHAVGVIQVGDSSQLHNRPLMIKVALRPAQTAEQSGDGKPHDASNEVKGVKAFDPNAAPAMAPQAAPVAPPVAQPAAPAAWTPPAAPVAAAPAPAAWTPPPAAQPAPVAPAAVAPAAAPVAEVAAPAGMPPWAAAPEAQPTPAPAAPPAVAPAAAVPATPPWATPPAA